jgi:nitric oxide reductase subunit C
MNLGNARIIFWGGTLISAAIFGWLTYDFHRQEETYAHNSKIDEQVVAGKKVWHKYNCNNCHTILGFGGYYAPDMTKAYYRLGENNIISIVMKPEEVFRNSFRKMPSLGVAQEEAKDLVKFLHWTADIENRNWPPQDEKYVQAAKLRDAQPDKLQKTDIVLGACGGCHSFVNQGRDIAGDFSELAKETGYDRETLIRYMQNPQSVNPDSDMPPQNVTPETAAIIADFILSLR